MRFVSIMQPVFMPWLGYFEQMAVTDEFVFMDDAQYTAQDWRNRNRVKTAQGPVWLTVPVKNHTLSARILDVEIDQRRDWQRKHLETIRQSYGKSRYFDDVFPLIADWYERGSTCLADFTVDGVDLFAGYLGIATPRTRSSEISREHGASPTERLIEIASARDCGGIYLGARARDYLDLTCVGRHGIEVVFQNYAHPEYEQRYPPFMSHMAVVDVAMNCGPASLGIILSSPLPAPLSGRTTR